MVRYMQVAPSTEITYDLYGKLCGIFTSFNTENRLKYSFQSVFNAVPALHFRDDKVSIAKICLVPITVSQLKCALHILIGDWYKELFQKGKEEAPPAAATAGAGNV